MSADEDPCAVCGHPKRWHPQLDTTLPPPRRGKDGTLCHCADWDCRCDGYIRVPKAIEGY